MKMKAFETFSVNLTPTDQKYRVTKITAIISSDSSSTRKKKRKRWRSKTETLPVVIFVFSVFLTSSFTPVSSYNDDKNWKISDNSLTSKINKKNFKDDTLSDFEGKLGGHGGTKWASATEEAYDERRDAEIFQAVFSSIAEWEERRRNHLAKRKHKKHRRKRSQSEKVDQIEEEEDKEPVQVCYEELGCFQEAGYIDLLPNSPEEVNTRYLLYNSRKSRGDTPLLDVSAQNISTLWEWVSKAFNVSAPTKVIIHGFGSSCSNVWVYEMRSALMSVEDCNVICVDWEAGATIPNYVRAAANTRLVGKQVAILLSGLEKYVNLSVRNVHVIGFSLGAHVAGFAGSELRNLSRITGLDPAGPLFESQDRRARLDSQDAHFVDVIHSNGENLILGGLGAWQAMGDVDFYPNGGRMQKGCTNLFVGAVSDMIWSANEVYGRSLCNHRRAYKFFTDSVSAKCQFPAVPCESYDHFVEGKCFPCENIRDCSNMGYYADKFSGRGTLYLLTRDEEPFCANQYMVRVENALDKESTHESTKLSTFGKIQITLIGDLELNETFVITQKKDEKLVSGESVSRIIVPHPALQNFLKLQILYSAYKGWLSSGHNKWKINKISLTNSYGQVLSVCKEDLVLESGVPVFLQLVPKNCDISDNTVDNNRTTKPLEHDLEKNHFTDEYYQNQTFISMYPHTQVIQIGNEILSIKEAGLSSKLNVTPEWTNSTSSKRYNKYNGSSVSLYDNNVTNIGIGVTEYLNDPWKQKGELFETPSINVLNNLDGISDEHGEARRLVFKHPKKDNISSTNTNKNIHQFVYTTNTSSQSMTSVNGKSSFLDEKQQNPYEFVVDHAVPSFKISTNAAVQNSESKITEPVLKPKSSSIPNSLHSRKSSNAHRPNYGKSINVNNEWQVTSTTIALINKQSNINSIHIASTASNYLNASTIRTNARMTTADNLGTLVDTNGDHERILKKPYESSKNTSSLFMVQFLPQKLISFFEQAERYARLAFLPFISSQQEYTKNNPEKTRRVRTFNNNRWNPLTVPHNEKNEKFDLETDESKSIASIVDVPLSVRVTSSFPYAYQVHQQHLWQHVSHLTDNDYKYIPLVNKELNYLPKEQTIPRPHISINNSKR